MPTNETTPSGSEGGAPRAKSDTSFLRLFLLLFVASIVLLGAQLHSTIFKNPSLLFRGAVSEEDVNAELKAKDTDGDGISDYDEQTIYLTSPYLDDSDSDGKTDREELLAGTDPNCPTGRVCSAYDSGQASTDAASAVSSLGLSAEAPTFDTTNIRELLKNAGVSEADIAKLSDEELVRAYQNALQSALLAKTPSGTGSSTSSGASPANSGSVTDLKPAEIRTLLLENGASKDVVEKLTDAELLEAYRAALAKVGVKDAGGTTSTK